MRNFTIYIDNKASEFIKNKGIDEIYIITKYLQGPCKDNLCKLISSPEIVLSRPDMEVFLLSQENVKIYCDKPIKDSVQRFGGKITISYSMIMKRMTVKGIPYNL